MDDFLKKYGWVVVGGVLIVIAILFAEVFGQEVADAIKTFVETFSTYVETAISSLQAPTLS